ncbi:hypothetical protein GWK47_001187 [Chionoecetes opilio]|uniref:Uncharacterized protein n=1 Tax=Chionoecetes opilio TaxID=41210 RepID=A0A8J4XYA2_CHIOP|nr:hypothetical protein GWK47_001187 [Chionoecetes opilio]
MGEIVGSLGLIPTRGSASLATVSSKANPQHGSHTLGGGTRGEIEGRPGKISQTEDRGPKPPGSHPWGDTWNEHGKGTAVLGRVAKTPAGLALAWSRAVRFNRVVDPSNINAIREILPFESDFGNVGRGLTAAPGWDGVAVNCNGIIILCQKVEEDIRALRPFGVIDWARTRGGGNCSSSGVKSNVGHDVEWVAVEVFKVEQCMSLGLGFNCHQVGPVGVGTECKLANLPLETCRET